MKLDPVTNELFTDDGTLLKKLHCPLDMQWDNLNGTAVSAKLCQHCSRTVHDTASLTDEEVQQLVIKDPHTCFKVGYNQPNITII